MNKVKSISNTRQKDFTYMNSQEKENYQARVELIVSKTTSKIITNSLMKKTKEQVIKQHTYSTMK